MAAARSAKKAHEVVADQLRQRIVSGELAEGDRLPPEEELTEQFGIARTTLREALRVLESQGLISIKRGRGGGPIVTHPSLEPVAMALAVSLQLQAHHGRRPRRRAPDDRAADRRPARALATTTTTSTPWRRRSTSRPTPPNGNDGSAFGLAAAHVHATLVERSGNRTLATLSALLQNMVRRLLHGQHGQRRPGADAPCRARLPRACSASSATATSMPPIAHWEATMRYTIRGRDSERAGHDRRRRRL